MRAKTTKTCDQCGGPLVGTTKHPEQRFCSLSCSAQSHHPDFETRVKASIDTSAGPDECWPWRAVCNYNGYGVLSLGNKNVMASRAAWELAKGPIPVGLFVLHRCDNPPCCNPAHLFLGTQKDNLADAKSKGRTRNGNLRGAAHGGSKLSEADVLLIRGASGTNQTIAARFGIGHAQVSKIRNRQSWRHLLADLSAPSDDGT